MLFAQIVHAVKPCLGGDAHAGAVDVLVQAIAADVLLAAVKVEVGECGCGGGIA